MFPLVLVAAGCLTYANSLRGPFLFDDGLGIVQNTSLTPWNLWRVLHPGVELPVAGRPLVNLSLAANRAAGGLDVTGYHLVNIALHIACALLLFGIVRRTLEGVREAALRDRAEWVAFASALIWIVHPLASEPVDYIIQRTESMMACCFLLTLYASIRSASSKRLYWPAIAVTACAAGMACKESMVIAPLVVALYDVVFVFKSASAAIRRRWRFYAALACSWLLLALLVRSGPRSYSAGFNTRVGEWEYLVNQTVMVARYLLLAFWPRNLVLWYGPTTPLPLRDAIVPGVLVLGLLAATVWALARRPAAGFLGAWVFMTLAPTSSFVPIATEVGAERRMYLPLMAIIVAVVIAAVRFWEGRPQGLQYKPAMAVLAVVVATLALLTAGRNREYRSPLGMATTVVERWPTGGSHDMLGVELSALNRHAEATKEFRLAVDTFPRARYHLGNELLAAGEPSEGVQQLREFIRDEPMLLEVISAHLKIGDALVRAKQWEAGIAEFRQVLSMTPSNADARTLLVSADTEFGIELSQNGNHDEQALQLFHEAASLDPRNAAVRANLARALLIRNNPKAAETEAREAVSLDSQSASNRDLLGQALALQGDPDQAATEFQEALRLDPADRVAQTALVQLRHLRVR